MKLKGHFQISGNLKAANFPQATGDGGGFYGISVKQHSGVESFKNINTLSFDDTNFYISQNEPNNDEAMISFRGISSTSTPGITSITVTDGTNVQDDSTINFNKNDFYISTNLEGEPVVNLMPPAYTYSVLLASLGSTQTTNVAAGDHVKWDTKTANIGDKIVLDTTTTYTSSAGPSIGRFSLAAGRTYQIMAGIQVQVATGVANEMSLGIRTDSGSQPSGAVVGSRSMSPAQTGNLCGLDSTVAIITSASSTALYEIRITAVTGASPGIVTNSYLYIREL